MISLKEIMAVLDKLDERLDITESRVDGLEDKISAHQTAGRTPR